MVHALQKKPSPERGASLVEYVLLALLVSLAALLAVTQLGQNTAAHLSNTTLNDALSGSKPLSD
jgi:Flp pilus assembly pilin Flp